MRAASAITSGSAPNSCAEIGCSSAKRLKYFSVLVDFLRPVEAFTPWELVNSVMMRPQPPNLRINRRNTVSVTPAMGARTVPGSTITGPIR